MSEVNLTKMEQLKRQIRELEKEVSEAKSKIKDMNVYDVLNNRHKLCIHNVEYVFLNEGYPDNKCDFLKSPYITLYLNFEDGSRLNLNVSLKDAYID